jgi:hypothetical protein
MFRKFKSLAHEQKHGYAYDSQAWDSKAPIESHFRMFETYGDGLCQHSPDYSVQVEFLADYLASPAQAMLGDAELANELRFTIWQRPDVKHIAWAASVIYKAPKDGDWNHKRTYFSAKEMKLSKAPAKQYDKRYEEVREIHDGSPKSIFRILIPEYADGWSATATPRRSGTGAWRTTSTWNSRANSLTGSTATATRLGNCGMRMRCVCASRSLGVCVPPRSQASRITGGTSRRSRSRSQRRNSRRLPMDKHQRKNRRMKHKQSPPTPPKFRGNRPARASG